MTIEDDPFFREPSLKRSRHARPVPINVPSEQRDDAPFVFSSPPTASEPGLAPEPPATARGPLELMPYIDPFTGQPYVGEEEMTPASTNGSAPEHEPRGRPARSRGKGGKRRAPKRTIARQGGARRTPPAPSRRRAAPPPGTGPPSKRRRARRRKQRPFIFELPGIIITALIISILIKTFLVQAFYIPSGSMEKTLLVDDRVLVNKLVDKTDEVMRGDVVVFRDPGGWLGFSQPGKGGISGAIREALVFVGLAPAVGDEDLIKRVIGVGGDRVKCCDDEGRVTVNGVALDEPYLFPGNVPSLTPFDVVVPEGKLWVMGDHRAASGDSRAHQQQPGASGFVPVDNVIGRAVVIVWPVARAGKMSRPKTFEQGPLQKSP